MTADVDTAAIGPQQLYSEQVRLLYAALPMGMLVGQINAFILTYILWYVLDHRILLVWLGIFTAVTMARYGLIYAWRRHPAAHTDAARWGRLITLGTTVSGAIWGSAGILLFPADLTHQVFVLLILAGMTAGAVVSFSALWDVGLMFILLTLAPLSVRLFMEGQQIHTAMGVMSILFMSMMVLTTHRMYRTTLVTLRLRFENRGLVTTLAEEKGATEDLNQELMREIVERGRIEEGLRQSEARVRALIESMPDGIITIDDQGRIESLNPAAERIFGTPQAELLGRNFTALLPEDDRDEYDDYMRDHIGLERGKSLGFGLEVRGLRRNGHEFPMELAISNMWYEHRHLFIGIVRDISERRAVDRMKNDFLATVNHELRTPLTSVLGSLGLLSEGIAGELSERGTSLLNITRSNVERLVRLIGNILDMDDIQAGRMRLDFRAVNMGQIVESAMEDNRVAASAAGAQIVLNRNLPDAMTYGDRERLRQVINHLLSNALKYSPRGAKIDVALERVHGVLRLSVTDAGPGVPAAFRQQLFQPFSRAETGDDSLRSGAGLGLSIARAIIEHHAGNIGLDDTRDAGACFYFELPELHNSGRETTVNAPEQ
jgi:PAS domain S-box-containing protein